MWWCAPRPDRHQLLAGRLVSLPIATLIAIAILACAACAPVFPLTPAAPQHDLPVIRTPDTQMTPTVPPLSYTVGAWPSSSAPAAGSRVTIFISFRDAGQPVAGGAASAVVHYPGETVAYGPVATAANGYASLAIPVGGVVVGPAHASTNVLVDVHVSYRGTTYSAQISFAPLG